MGPVVPNCPRVDTHFRIASNTKTMTAAVIVLLAQEEKLRFDDPVSKKTRLRRRQWRAYHHRPAPQRCGVASIIIRLRQNLRKALTTFATRSLTPEALLAIAFKHAPLFAPGRTNCDYCNTNYVLLGLVACKVEGEALATIFRKRLFAPLGMKEKLLLPDSSVAIPEPYAHGYLYGGASYALVDAPYPADLQAAAKAGKLKPNDDTRQNPSYSWAAGGVVSTAADLATWMRALVGGKLPTPIISANGSRAPYPRIRANLSARNTAMAYP